MSAAKIQPERGLQINKGLPRQWFNRFTVGMLHSPLHALGGFSRLALVLTYRGRKSGRAYRLPLAYMREGNVVTTFALFTNTVWWQNLRDSAPVTVRLEGRDHAATATLIQAPAQVAQGLLAFAVHNPQMARGGYYRLPRRADGQIDMTALQEMAQTRVMIQLRLRGTDK